MPVISNNDIAKAIYLATKDKSGFSLNTAMKNTARMLSRRKLLGKIGGILEALERLVNKEEKIAVVKVTSARKLHSETKAHLKSKLERRYHAKKIIWEEAFDESILGGMKIEVNNEVLDLTLRGKINKLQTHLMQK